MLKPIILLGYFQEAIELCESAGFEIVGIVDKKANDKFKYTYLGDDEYVLKNYQRFNMIPVFLVPDNIALRKKLYELYNQHGFKFATVISPNASISKYAQLGEGVMVQTGCNISADVKIGKCVRVNSCANIMHDSVIGDFAVIAPSSVVLGRCRIAKEVYIGANSTILPEIDIGQGATVGAGAVVNRNVDQNSTVVGVPAKKIK